MKTYRRATYDTCYTNNSYALSSVIRVRVIKPTEVGNFLLINNNFYVIIIIDRYKKLYLVTFKTSMYVMQE